MVVRLQRGRCADFNGTDSFTFKANDGALDSNVATLSLTVNPINDAPMAQAGSASGDEGMVIGGTLVATDVDSPSWTYSLVAQAAHGTVVVNPDGTYSYTPNADFNGTDSFTFKANDGALDSNIATLSLTVNPANDAPVNHVPGVQSVVADTDRAISGLSISDVDAGSGTMTTTLSVAHGTLSLASAGGAAVAGSGTGTVTLTGTLAQINTTLAAAGNLIYRSAAEFTGADALTITTSDNGNTGSGGPASDTDQVAINVTESHFTGTPGDDTFTALPGTAFINAGAGIDTITFNFKLTDAAVTYSGNQVIIDGPGGSHTVLTGLEKYVFTDGTVNNADGDPLVDDLYYYSQYHDVWNAHVDADAHYHGVGWKEGRDPDAFFSTSFYLSLYQDVKAAGIDPLFHFEQIGWKEGRQPSAAFDDARYLQANPDVAAAHLDPLWHFLAIGASEGRQPFVLGGMADARGFDAAYYLQHNPDVQAAEVDPLWHFQTIGWKEGRDPNAWFDTAGYLAHYTDVAAANINPLDHYHVAGWREGRDPSVDFDTTAYLAAYPDVAAAGIDPLAHFLQHGSREGRGTFADGTWG